MATKSTKQAGVNDFRGATVISFESRMAEVTENNIIKWGGKPLVAPSMQEVPLEKSPEAFLFAEKLLKGEIDVLVLMTGVGFRTLMKTLFTRFEEEKILGALSRCIIVSRGPKPVKALTEYKLTSTIIVPEPNTWREIMEELISNKKSIDLDGKMVAVQEYGIPNDELLAVLKKQGANTLKVPVYRWALPDDLGPLEEAIDAIIRGQGDLVMFTSAQQIRHTLQVATGKGLEDDLKAQLKKKVICSIGPTTSEALRTLGLPVDFEPSHPKLGMFIGEAAKQSSDLIKEKKGGSSGIQLTEKDATADDGAKRKESVFLKACRGEKTPYTPIWLMRQAGRYMKEYRKVRNQFSFLEMCKRKEVVAEVTITAVEKIKADAAIIFSDILVVVEPLGFKLDYAAGDGPSITGKASTKEEIDNLPEIDPETLSYVYDAIRMTRSSLNQGIPLIGFAGAPFTLASYIIEGGGSRTFQKTKTLMYQDKGAWDALMEKISRGLVGYLKGQIKAGADALQLFDSWVGCLGPEDYREYVQPHVKTVLDGISGEVPVIHFGTGTAPLLKDMRDAGGDVIGVDFKTELDKAWAEVGYDKAVQGNMDPLVLMAESSVIEARAKRILDQAEGRPGHIFNLGHGILPQTPVENVIRLIEFVKNYSHKAK